MEPKNIYVKDKESFMEVKQWLDGRVFWREKGDKVEIKMAVSSKQVKHIIKSLKD